MFAGQFFRSSLGDLLRLYTEYMHLMQHFRNRIAEEDTYQPGAAQSSLMNIIIKSILGALQITTSEPKIKPQKELAGTYRPIFKQMASIVAPRIPR